MPERRRHHILLVMAEPLRQVLADLEREAGADAAAAFSRLVVEYLADTRTGDGRVSTALSPADLAARFAEPLPAEGRPLDDVLVRLRSDVLPDCNRLTHPRSMGHQVSAPLPVAVWTEALTAALNQSGAVWEMSPVGTIIETQVVRWMCDLAGFGPEAGGTFTSGGTEATFAGLLAARQAAQARCMAGGRRGRTRRWWSRGEHAHYGVARAVGELGIGSDNAVVVPSRDYRMDVPALKDTLEALRAGGRQVMAVVATAGTTPTGSFDDIDAIGRICEERGLWLHVDGAHGASALLSPAHRARLKGIHRARSIAWDPHKMMLMPLTASVVLVKDERDLEAAFSQQAPYLFHGRDGERNWDQGLRSFTCSRRIDALEGVGGHPALRRLGSGRALRTSVREPPARCTTPSSRGPLFRALHAPESNILCFRYVGDAALPDDRLDALNLELRTVYNREGDGWITSTVLGGRRVLRVTMMNPRTTARRPRARARRARDRCRQAAPDAVMFDARYVAFATLSALLVMSPGATLAVVVETALGHGRRAALLTVVGVGLANAALASAAALGLSVLVDRWPSSLHDRPRRRRRLPGVSRCARTVAGASRAAVPSAGELQWCQAAPRGDECAGTERRFRRQGRADESAESAGAALLHDRRCRSSSGRRMPTWPVPSSWAPRTWP